MASQGSTITHRLIQAYLERGNRGAALTALEAGKAVRLRLDLSRSGRLPGNLLPAEQAEYIQLTQQVRQIAAERRALGWRDLPPWLRAAALDDIRYRHEASMARLRELEARDPDFVLRPLDYPAMRTLAIEHNLALVFLQPTNDATLGMVVFVVHPDSPSEAPTVDDVLQLDQLTTVDLHQLLSQLPEGVAWEQSWERFSALLTAGRTGEPVGWFVSYSLLTRLPHPVTLQDDVEALWQATVVRVLDELRTRLAMPLATRLWQLKARRVVIIPGDRLGLLPLHAMPVADATEGGNDAANAEPHAARPTPQTSSHPLTTLGDAFEVSYAPSATTLARCLETRRTAPGKQRPHVGGSR